MDSAVSGDELLSLARLAFEEGDSKKSLKLCQKAYHLKPCPKLMRKIERIHLYIAETEKENTDNNATKSTYSVQDKMQNLIRKAKELYKLGQFNESLDILKIIYQEQPSEKIRLKIEGLEQLIESENNHLVENNPLPNSDSAESLVEQARALYQNGSYEDCLALLRRAQNIEFSDKVERKIDRLEQQLKSMNLAETSDVEFVDGGNDDTIRIDEQFQIPKALYEKLYTYQRDGVRWLWQLHLSSPGGILADDMGLGKTVQVIAFLSGLFLTVRKPSTVLVVMPVSVLLTWEIELKKWSPALRVFVYHETSRVQRLRGLSSIQRHGGIVLTTYGMLTSSSADLAADINSEPQFLCSKKSSDNSLLTRKFGWTYLVLDEAHKIKNPAAKTTKAAHALLVQHYILLTGTAVQNNLKELWSLYHLIHKGRLLGTQKTFQLEYERPIMRSRERDSTRAEKVHGQLMAQSLRKLIGPFFLRRMKSDVLMQVTTTGDDAIVTKNRAVISYPPELKQLPPKTELVVWIYLSLIQETSYRSFLEMDHIKELLLGRNSRSPLVELLILKKLCDHPRLLTSDQCSNLNLDCSVQTDIQPKPAPSVMKLVRESGKLLFVEKLMIRFLAEHQSEDNPPRTLIFSQSLKFLDLTERVIMNVNNRMADSKYKHRILRLDGRVTKVHDRLEIIRTFEDDKSYTVMLLTTQVGGVGLTITSANRVIILDPSWNPATDAQAVDRVYRIGQKSHVIVYRLITCATVEEKIYRRQIFKDSVIRQTTTSVGHDSNKQHDPYRYFTRQDLKELFKLGNTRMSMTQKQLEQLHDGSERWTDSILQPTLHFLTGEIMEPLVFGLSFHDLMFSKESVRDDDDNEDDKVGREHENAYIANRLYAAEMAIAKESGKIDSSLANNLANISLHNKMHQLGQIEPNQLFKPSTSDTQRPMFNQPVLGNAGRNRFVEPRQVTEVICVSDDESVESNKTVDGPSQVIDQLEDSLAQSLQEMSISQVASNRVGSQMTPNDRRTNNNDDDCASPKDKILLSPFANRNSFLFKSNMFLQRSTPLSSRSVNLKNQSLSMDEQNEENVVTDDDDDEFETRTNNNLSEPISKSNGNLIHMDISVAVDDNMLANTVEMKSLHEILINSNIADELSRLTNDQQLFNSNQEHSRDYDDYDDYKSESKYQISKLHFKDKLFENYVEDSIEARLSEDTGKHINSDYSKDLSIIGESDLIEPSI